MAGTAITVAPEFVEETVYRAAPGQVGGMETGDAPLGAVLDKAFSRSAFLRSAVWGQLVWSGRLEAGGTAGSPSIKVGPIDAVCLRAAETRSGNSVDVWRAFLEPAETTLGISHVEGAPGSLTSDTWYYVYVYSNGTTTLQWQITTSPPTESGAPTVLRAWKRGQTANYRYLGCFRTDGSGNPIPMVMANGRYQYTDFDMASPLHTASTANISTFTSALALTSRVPPHVRQAVIRVQTYRASLSEARAGARVKADGASYAVIVHDMNNASSYDVMQTDALVVLGSTQSVVASTFDTDTTCRIHVAAFNE